MIQFKKLRYKNFLAAGNNFIEIDFTAGKNTIIVGENGAGKSTFIDAICFGLYNRAFRNINKPLLVNSIISKNLVVEIEFDVSKDSYLIRRGIKPAVFEILKNGELINQTAETKDYQSILEKQILKMNYKTFTQIVILGSAAYTPFMKLPAHSRREVTEDLLDVQIFSVMNTLLREKVSNNKLELQVSDSKIDLIEAKIEMNAKRIADLKVNNEELMKRRTDEVLSLKEEVIKDGEELTKLEIVRKDAEITIKNLSKHENRIKSIDKLIGDLEKKIDKVLEDNRWYSETKECPTCKQSIHHDVIERKFYDNNLILEELKKGIDELTKKKTEEELEYRRIQIPHMTLIENRIMEVNVRINSNQKHISLLLKEIEKLSAKNEDIHVDDQDQLNLEAELKEAQEKKEDCLRQRETLGIAATMLKDGGIKTRVVKQYLPVMNKLINQFLSSLDFSIEFTLDENFNEKIYSRFKDEFSYDSFSEGEKVRINLAILFCWRAIAKMRNSASTSLLIMDEVFDGSLDAYGADNFLRMLDTLTPNTNVFVISHNPNIKDRFDRHIMFRNEKNFSVMET